MESIPPRNNEVEKSSHGKALDKNPIFSACRVEPGLKINSTSLGMMAEPPTLPCRDDVMVENGDASPKSCLPSLEMRSPTAAGG